MLDLKEYIAAAEEAVGNLDIPASPAGLYDPIRYTLQAGGKRIRPVLTLAVADAVAPDGRRLAANQAAAIEMFHNFTLLHDDVMDRADMRRGRPTVHRRWSESTAILSGDAMLTLATQLIADCTPDILPAVLGLFNNTAMEIYQGQQLDMEFESRKDVTVGEYMEMIRLKTSVLLACACRMGAMLAGASETACQSMYDYGIALGLAFQLRDDWLDTFGDPEVFGKAIGGDIVNGKKTWLHLNAVKADPEGMAAAMACKTRAGKVRRVKAVYERLGLSEKCSALIDSYVARAVGSLSGAGLAEEYRQWFADLALRLCKREK